MDCKNARLLWEFARPGASELAPDDTAALEEHLAECGECGTLAVDERRLDAHLANAMKAVPIPEALAARLLNRLSAERDRWYRQWLVRCAGILGAAAALVLVVWGGLIWRNSARQLEVDEIIRLFADKPTATPDRVEDWFQREHSLRIFAPSDKLFDYRWLVDYRLEEFEGKRVPALFFVNNSLRTQDTAKVFIVSIKEFHNLQELAGQQPQGSGGYKVMVIPNHEKPGVFYVFLFKDGSEHRFLVKRDPVA